MGGLLIFFLAFASALTLNSLRAKPLPLTLSPAPNVGGRFADFAALQRLLADPTVTVIDARSPEIYALGHLPRAINVPPSALLADAPWASDYLPALTLNSHIVVYCAETLCPLADRLADSLRESGFISVLVYAPGFDGFAAEGGKAVE